MLTNKWSKVSIDRFASHTNKKTQRFNSKYICPGSEGVNAFSVDWSNKNNLLVPPVYLIPKTIKHFMSSKYSAKAILVCPYWPSSTFWPLLFKAEGEFHVSEKIVQMGLRIQEQKLNYLAYIVYELGVQQLQQNWKSVIDFLKSMEDGGQKKLKMDTFTKVLKRN